ncbi:crescerin-like protein che-12 [Homalodisca vitripennis]|uniref:crescerin-like protein che-12 n=1 Tax=Homalodisca vitripennis TaxID=197043 RepID=UPI001EEAD9E8|nr:crescerin-like protein che-12 [Homalodisca vitripennis]
MKMFPKLCCFGAKVIPVSDEVMTISLSDSRNNNFTDKVVKEVPEPTKHNYHCLRCCFWRRSKNEVIPFVHSPEYKPHNSGDRDNGLRPVLSRQSKYPPAQTNGHVSPPPMSPARFVSPSPSPLAPLPPPSPSPSPLRDATLPLVASSQSLQVEDLSGDNASASEEPRSRPSSQPKEDEVSSDHVDTLVIEEERLNTPPPVELPPPPPPPPPEPEPEPETTQTEELTGEDKSSPLHQRRIGKPTGKPRLRATKGTTRDVIGSASPDVAPFSNPKEALNRCLQQLDHPEWEVTVQGLQTLVRLSCHHTTLLMPVLHQVVVAVTKHIRNLRSQVARVACKAATNLFTSLGRGIENEMDELCAVLLNRTADTNRFLRADCNAALDAMVDHVGSSRTVASIVNKGAKHQNAIVRATACRLLLRLCGRLGPERVLSLPRETRDAILNTGARSLTEGSLDTRRFAKEMFVLLSQDQRLPSLLTEVVPTTVMRSISKVLARLTAK